MAWHFGFGVETGKLAKTALGDDQGPLVDADGKNVFGCAYRAEHLTGAGTIGARGSNALAALCSKFGIEALTGASDRPIVGSHDFVSVSHRPSAALMSVDAKTYVTRPAQARLGKTGRLARTKSAKNPAQLASRP